MNIFIPITKLTDHHARVLNQLSDHIVHFIFEKPTVTKRDFTPRVRKSFDTIKSQKNRALRLGSECREEYFVLQDEDIYHIKDGIGILKKMMDERPDLSALGLQPCAGKNTGGHVTSQCIMFRTKDVQSLQVEYVSGCFCGALKMDLQNKGKKVEGHNELGIIQELREV